MRPSPSSSSHVTLPSALRLPHGHDVEALEARRPAAVAVVAVERGLEEARDLLAARHVRDRAIAAQRDARGVIEAATRAPLKVPKALTKPATSSRRAPALM
jgi:hypothetical protein